MLKCKNCLVEKERVYIGRDAAGRSRYRDAEFKVWNGRECPPCHKASVRLKAELKAKNQGNPQSS